MDLWIQLYKLGWAKPTDMRKALEQGEFTLEELQQAVSNGKLTEQDYELIMGEPFPTE